MIARALVTAKVTNNHHNNNSSNNYQRQESTIQVEKDKALIQYDKDIFRSFWAGVHTATIIQKDKLLHKSRPKFRKSLNDSMVEQIFVDHSREVRFYSFYHISLLSFTLPLSVLLLCPP